MRRDKVSKRSGGIFNVGCGLGRCHRAVRGRVQEMILEGTTAVNGSLHNDGPKVLVGHADDMCVRLRKLPKQVKLTGCQVSASWSWVKKAGDGLRE